MPELIQDVDALRSYVEMLRRNKITLGLVPTLGALHDGHRSLMRRSYTDNDRTVVSIYVNPLQFGPGEDFEKYPRTLEADLAACDAEQVNVVFAPSRAVMQPPGRSTTVRVEGLSRELEGVQRPTHFDGVATIVARLLNLVQPDAAYFGQKDYQQSVVIRRMALDLAFPSRIVVCPTVRDPDGLALSSRNVYLSAEDREEALRLPRALRAAEDAILQGETDGDTLRTVLREALASSREDVVLDYAEVCHPDTLAPLPVVGTRAVVLAALRVGTTRLIDNRVVTVPGTTAWED